MLVPQEKKRSKKKKKRLFNISKKHVMWCVLDFVISNIREFELMKGEGIRV